MRYQYSVDWSFRKQANTGDMLSHSDIPKTDSWIITAGLDPVVYTFTTDYVHTLPRPRMSEYVGFPFKLFTVAWTYFNESYSLIHLLKTHMGTRILYALSKQGN